MILLFKIITEYSIWFLPLCIIIGLVYGSILYYKEWKTQDNKNLILVMFSARVIVVSLLAFLLLSPFVQSMIRHIQKPIVVIAQDNSESLLLCKDSAYYTTDYLKKISAAREKLEDKYDVQFVRFGNNPELDTSINYSDKSTNYSTLFEELNNRYENKNLGAVVLASDGIYTSGMSPVYAFGQQNITCPVYTIAMGDTSLATDIYISDISFNKIAFQGNTFPIKIKYQAIGFAGQHVDIRVMQGDKRIDDQRILINTNEYLGETTFLISAEEVGTKSYKVEIAYLDGELSRDNNQRIAIVDILKSKQKILILSDGPHPDIGALRTALDGNVNYDVDVEITRNYTGAIDDYNFVILYQLPSLVSSAAIVKDLVKNEIPLMIFAGSRTDYNKLNKLELGLTVSQTKSLTDEVFLKLNDDFELFDIEETLSDFFLSSPPMLVPFGDYTKKFDFVDLATQNVGAVSTGKTLACFGKIGEHKIGYFLGEGLWKTRMSCYRQYEDFALFDDFISKIASYMALKEKRSNFMVNVKSVVNENEPVVFGAEVYNESYEAISDEDIELTLKDKEGKEYSYVFDKQSGGYSLSIANFPVGEYQYEARVEVGGKELLKQGAFVIVPVNIEAYNTLANHSDLFRISDKSGGKFYLADQFSELVDDIESNTQIVAVSTLEEKLKELISLPLFFILIIVLFTIEWFLRKYYLGQE